MMTKLQALGLAARTAKMLGKHLGLRWTPSVMENLGWHARAVSSDGRWRVHPFVFRGRVDGYTAFLNAPERQPGGRWAESGSTPRKAVNATRAKAREDLTTTLGILDACDIAECFEESDEKPAPKRKRRK